MYKLSKIRGGYILYGEENIRHTELDEKDTYLWVSSTGRVVYHDSKLRAARRKVYWVYNVKHPQQTVMRYIYYVNKKRKK